MTSKSSCRNRFDERDFERRVEAKTSEKVSMEKRLARIEVYQEMFHRPGGICDQHSAAIEDVMTANARVEKRVITICTAFAVVLFLLEILGPRLFLLFGK